jgi:hypothetical protein
MGGNQFTEKRDLPAKRKRKFGDTAQLSYATGLCLCLGQDAKSVIAGKFDVSVLPKGGENGKNAAALGGWQLMVSAYSKNPEEAADLVRASPRLRPKEARDRLQSPPFAAGLYADADVLAKVPGSEPPVLENAVARRPQLAELITIKFQLPFSERE